MKVLCTSDFHLDHVTAGQPRSEEIRVTIQDIIRVCDKERPDLFMFLGDLCDPDSGAATLRSIAYAGGVAVTLSTIVPHQVWLAGNHDVTEDGHFTTTFTPLRHLFRALPGAHLCEEPGSIILTREVSVLALPYPAQRNAYDPAQLVEQVSHNKRLRTVVVAGHLQMAGIIPGEETNEMPRGRDVPFPFEAIDKHLRPRVEKVAMFNGHYHARQVFKEVVIPGSLARLTFGEEAHRPGYWLGDV